MRTSGAHKYSKRCTHTLTRVIRHMPVLMSHILMVLSLEPERRNGPDFPFFLLYRERKKEGEREYAHHLKTSVYAPLHC